MSHPVGCNYSTTKLMGEIIPPYAILLHTWEDGEVSHQVVQANEVLAKPGYEKIRQCCRIAASDGFHSELSEVINSMYRWYAEAGVSYFYFPDVDLNLRAAEAVARFRRSRWFTRGWPLFESAITDITGISPHVLVAQKISWVSKRTTTRVEDVAYSLMGLFGVHMPMLYGEGSNAFKRLQEEILRSADDHTIFAWRESEGNPAQLGLRSGVLATSPAKFAHSGKFILKA
ncbi:hypothetical protein BKA65DRAFT_527276 [Rhexocercosporidium sp. MPI-PUGE-AT-0058]|nr:hypothetical protein BKA65DRAFT_527276 [Rhexocercosporidium sp. MPI-PUGE-AT-0058]